MLNLKTKFKHSSFGTFFSKKYLKLNILNDSFRRSSLRLVDKTLVGSQNPLFWSSILSLLGNLVGVLAISSGYLPLPLLERTLNSDLSSSEENSIIGKTKYTQQFKLPIKEIEKQRLKMSDDEERLQNFFEFYIRGEFRKKNR